MADTYTVAGLEVLRDGESILECIEPEMAQGMAILLNQAVAYDRDARRRVTAHVRAQRVVELENLIENPSRALPKMEIEAPAHWAARAVMALVDLWL